MRKWKLKLVVCSISIAFAISICSTTERASSIATIPNQTAATQKKTVETIRTNCSVGTTAKYVAKKLKLTISGTGYKAYRNALVDARILLSTELTDTSKSINKGELALLASRVMAYKEEKENTERSETIVSKKRILDLSKLEEPYKSSAVWVFGEGVMVGSSNGKYSQSRKFKPTDTVTAGAMKSVILKALGKKDRSIISPDGQLTRTTNLPKNYKKYSYILASFPNKFYEQRFQYQYHIYHYEPEYLVDYVNPVDLERYKEKYDLEILSDEVVDLWAEKIKQNLTYRLNFNYKEVDSDWSNGLRNTYYKSYTDYDKYITQDIEDYVEVATKNKVIVKSDKIVVEPSTLYKDGSNFYFRCYLRFKVTSTTQIYGRSTGKQREIIYAHNSIALDDLAKGKWIDGYFDIGVSTSTVNDDGSTYAVSSDYLANWKKPDLSKYERQEIWCLY
ncbi:MAG: hypothetical protein ACERKN_03315 [Velocimicrobium sp.]